MPPSRYQGATKSDKVCGVINNAVSLIPTTLPVFLVKISLTARDSVLYIYIHIYIHVCVYIYIWDK